MHDFALTEIIRLYASERADRPAVIAAGATRSFADIDRDSSRLAQGLASLGVGRGDRVGCLTRYSEDCLTLQLAANKLGAVNMPLNWRLAPPELEYIINAGEIRALIADEGFLPALSQTSTPDVRRVLVSGPTESPDGLAVWQARFAASDPGYHPDLDETALQLGSSGTTGRPKLIEITYRNLLIQCRNGGVASPVGDRGWEDLAGPPPVFLNVMPNFHVSGTINWIATLYRGGISVFQPEFDPEKLVWAIGHYRVTESFLVPTMMRALLDLPGIDAADFSSLQRIGYGGSPITETLLRRALAVFKCGFLQTYGMTEVAGTLACLRPEDHHSDGPLSHLLRSAGKPVRGAEIRIVDPNTGQDMPTGEIGEIWGRTGHNMKGYYRNESATAEVFPEGRDPMGGWYQTGDIGYVREGYVYVHDRLRDMVISGGENIYPAEVENVLAAHPAVADVAVIGVPDEKWGEAVKACVELKPGAEAGADEIIAFARANLAHYKCPKSVEFVDRLPRNPSGKILRRVLRDLYWTGHDRPVG